MPSFPSSQSPIEVAPRVAGQMLGQSANDQLIPSTGRHDRLKVAQVDFVVWVPAAGADGESNQMQLGSAANSAPDHGLHLKQVQTAGGGTAVVIQAFANSAAGSRFRFSRVRMGDRLVSVSGTACNQLSVVANTWSESRTSKWVRFVFRRGVGTPPESGSGVLSGSA